MRKIIIDTNVLVSALLASHYDSATVQVAKLMLKGNALPVITDRIISEYEEVLRRRKFGFPEESVSVLIEEIKRKAIEAEPIQTDIRLPDEKDLPFLEAVLSSDDYVLITGNTKHFPFHERIMTAREFLDSEIAASP